MAAAAPVLLMEDTGDVTGRILVIDDEHDIAEILKEALCAEGHEVETALSGEDGLKMAAVSHYDLVFTDLGMPDMSGWEVASRMRCFRPRVPVVLVTGWGASLEESEVRGLGAGGALDTAKRQRADPVLDLVQIQHEFLAPQGRPLADGGQLGGLVVGETERRHFAVLLGELAEW